MIAGVIFILSREALSGYFKGFDRARFFRINIQRSTVVFLTAVFIALLATDPWTASLLHQWKTLFAERLADFGGALGRNVNPWFFLIAIYALAFALRSSGMRRNVFGSLFSAILASVMSLLLKFVFLRARPYAGFGHLSFFNGDGLLKDDRAFQSFSSGDVAVVAAIAFYFSNRTHNFFLKWFFCALPLATAFARVHAFKHWPSDTWLSVALGFVAAGMVFNDENNRPSTVTA